MVIQWVGRLRDRRRGRRCRCRRASARCAAWRRRARPAEADKKRLSSTPGFIKALLDLCGHWKKQFFACWASCKTNARACLAAVHHLLRCELGLGRPFGAAAKEWRCRRSHGCYRWSYGCSLLVRVCRASSGDNGHSTGRAQSTGEAAVGLPWMG